MELHRKSPQKGAKKYTKVLVSPSWSNFTEFSKKPFFFLRFSGRWFPAAVIPQTRALLAPSDPCWVKSGQCYPWALYQRITAMFFPVVNSLSLGPFLPFYSTYPGILDYLRLLLSKVDLLLLTAN